MAVQFSGPGGLPTSNCTFAKPIDFPIRGQVVVELNFDDKPGYLQSFSFMGWRDIEKVEIARLHWKGIGSRPVWVLDLRPGGKDKVFELDANDTFRVLQRVGNFLISGNTDDLVSFSVVETSS